MATVLNNDDEKKNAAGGMIGQPGAAPQGGTAPAPQPAGSGSWTNIGAFINANKDAISGAKAQEDKLATDAAAANDNMITKAGGIADSLNGSLWDANSRLDNSVKEAQSALEGAASKRRLLNNDTATALAGGNYQGSSGEQTFSNSLLGAGGVGQKFDGLRKMLDEGGKKASDALSSVDGVRADIDGRQQMAKRIADNYGKTSVPIGGPGVDITGGLDRLDKAFPAPKPAPAKPAPGGGSVRQKPARSR